MGFDISESRTNELNAGYDKTSEIKESDLNQAIKENNFFATNNVSESRIVILYNYSSYSIDNNKLPDLGPLIMLELVAGIIKNDLIIYESTVYPGATEDDCIPIIESLSGLTLNIDFFDILQKELIQVTRIILSQKSKKLHLDQVGPLQKKLIVYTNQS